MAFTIPNTADASVPGQAQVDKVDLDILTLGWQKYHVISGCAVTAQGTPDMTVAVSAGSVTNGGLNRFAVAGANGTITSAHATLNRYDLVCIDVSGAVTGGAGTGTIAVVAGTAAADPVFPAVPANRVPLAAVYVPATDTAIGSTQIIDKRIIAPFMDRCRVVLNADLTPTNTLDALTTIVWDGTDVMDTNSMHAPGGANPERVLAVEAGVYELAAHIWINANNAYKLQLKKNGSIIRNYVTNNADVNGAHTDIIVKNELCAANDYFEIVFKTYSTNNPVIESSETFFELIRVA